MKVRIKVIKKASGEEVYIPQIKRHWFTPWIDAANYLFFPYYVKEEYDNYAMAFDDLKKNIDKIKELERDSKNDKAVTVSFIDLTNIFFGEEK